MYGGRDARMPRADGSETTRLAGVPLERCARSNDSELRLGGGDLRSQSTETASPSLRPADGDAIGPLLEAAHLERGLLGRLGGTVLPLSDDEVDEADERRDSSPKLGDLLMRSEFTRPAGRAPRSRRHSSHL